MTATWDITLWLDELDEVDHVTLGLVRLLWQYRGAQPRMQGWLESYLNRHQSLEDVSLEVLVGRWLHTAEGVQLDNLGDIVGLLRSDGWTDAIYRTMLVVQTFVNRSYGQLADIQNALFRAGYPEIQIDEYPNAELTVSVSGFDYGEVVGPIVTQAVPAGVLLHWVFSDEADTDTFQTASTLGADDTDATTGFGDLTEATQTTGGYWSGGTTP